MCPACIASAATVFASASSVGGVAAVAASLVRALGRRASLNRLESQENAMQEPRIVSREAWLAARRQLLVKEKAHTRAQDALSAERRQLPMVRVEKDYVFDTPQGGRPLAGLFDGRSQLIVYHFMMGPDWAEGCPSCSLLADHIDASTVHLAQRDVSLVVVSRAPLAGIEAFKRRMGWRFRWVSSFGSDFNRDYHVSFTREELESGAPVYNVGTGSFPTDEAPGVSVFYRNGAGEVFHTYSAYARGGEPLIGVYHYLDLVPKGRDEGGLVFPMAWVRHHDRYAGALPAASETYVPPAGAVFVAPRPRAAACCEGHES
jgi:predicted dithiol-disulfide oxidoreductase (DUF899 family)